MRAPQHMWIMNVVWPVTALFGSAWIVWQYFAYGRLATHRRMHAAMERDDEMPNRRLTPSPMMVANGALHCGSGCTLGDICAEWLVFAVPAITIAPMRGLSFREGIIAAAKADTLSLTAWQVGMYGFMAIAYFAIFERRSACSL
jgi:Domain of unknown function (DUF4396)